MANCKENRFLDLGGETVKRSVLGIKMGHDHNLFCQNSLLWRVNLPQPLFTN